MESDMNFQPANNCMQYNDQQWYNDYQNFSGDDLGSKYKQNKYDNCCYYSGTEINFSSSDVSENPEKFKQYYSCMLNSEAKQRSQKEKVSYDGGFYASGPNEVKFQNVFQSKNYQGDYYKSRKISENDCGEALKSETKGLKTEFDNYDVVQGNDYEKRYDHVREMSDGYCENGFPGPREVSQSSCEGSLIEDGKITNSGTSTSLPIYPWMAGGIGKISFLLLIY